MSSREFFQKNEQMNSFLLLCDVFSFVFWKKLKTPKKPFEIPWHLESSSKNISKICTDPNKRSGLFKLWHTHVTAVHIVQCPIAIALYYVPSGEIWEHLLFRKQVKTYILEKVWLLKSIYQLLKSIGYKKLQHCVKSKSTCFMSIKVVYKSDR